MACALLFLCACVLLFPAGHGAHTGAGEGSTRKGGLTLGLGEDSHSAKRPGQEDAGEEGAGAGPLVARRELAAHTAVAASGSLPVKGAVHPEDAAALLKVAARWRKDVKNPSGDSADDLNLLATWDVKRPCSQWYGVTCNSATGRVTGIKLPRILQSQNFVFILGGPLPPELGSLPELRSLILARNSLTGPYPKQWGGLGKLSHLDLSDTDFSMMVSPVPKEVCNLTSLTYLNFKGITVTLPKAFLRLSRLATLNLGENGNLQAADIQVIGGLPGLKSLFLSRALLNNGPRDIQGLSRLRGLEQLDLSYNGFGIVPSFLSGFTGLLALNLGGISGDFSSLAVPSWVGSLERLTSLSLCCNFITGSIPEWVGNLKALMELNLVGNALTGSIPGKLGELAGLATIDLGYNQLSGSIPEGLGELTGLETLMLAGNQLSGSLPASLLKLWAHRLSAEVKGGVFLSGLLDVQNNYLNGPCYSSSVATLQCLSSNKTCQRIGAQELSGLAQNCFQGCDNSPFGSPPSQRSSDDCASFCGADGPNGPCNGHGICSPQGPQLDPKCTCTKGFVAPASNSGTCVPAPS